MTPPPEHRSGSEQNAPIALWCVPVPEIGGVARHVLDAARQGIPGYRIVVLCPEGALAEALRGQGSAVVTGAFGTGAGLAASVRTLRATVRALRPAVVHTHLAFADVVAAAALGLSRLPGLRRRGPVLATTEHGIAPEDSVYQSSTLRARVMNLVHGMRLRVTDVKLAVSASTAEVMAAKWGARGVRVVRNGVDAPALRRRFDAARVPVAPGVLRVLSLSRLAPEKNLDVLLEAFARVREQVPEATLEVAGEGPLRSQLEDRARALGVAEAVRFVGFADPIAAMGRADVLAQLSAWENLSYALLDAAAVGLPVVATDVGGNAEVLPVGSLVGSPEPETIARKLMTAEAGPGPATGGWDAAQMCAGIAAAYDEVRTPGTGRRAR